MAIGFSRLALFVAAGLALALMGALSVGERIGVPHGLVVFALLAALFGLSLAAALAARSQRPVDLFAGGRNLGDVTGALVLGLAVAGAARALLAPPLTAWDMGALALAALLAGAMRARGAYSFSDFVGLRFGARSLAGLAAVLALPVMGMALAALFAGLVRDGAVLSGYQGAHVAWALLGLAAFPLVFGGVSGLAFFAGTLGVLAGAAALAPPLAEAMWQVQGGGVDWARLGARAGSALAWKAALPAQLALLAFVVLIPLAGAARTPAVAGRTGAVGAALGLGLLALLAIGGALLGEAIGAQILGVPPERLPFWPFEPGVEGWLGVCGGLPDSPGDAARLCRNAGTSGPISIDALRFDPRREGEALAALYRLPTLFGTLWSAADLFARLVAMMALAQAIAGMIAHDLLFRLVNPRGLTSWRLAMQRLALLAVLAALFVWQAGFVPETVFAFLPAVFQQLAPAALLGAFALLVVLPLALLALLPFAARFAALGVLLGAPALVWLILGGRITEIEAFAVTSAVGLAGALVDRKFPARVVPRMADAPPPPLVLSASG